MTTSLPETVDGLLSESAFDKIKDLIFGKRAMVFGPGMGISPEIASLLRRTCRC
jgi:hypothetical protein